MDAKVINRTWAERIAHNIQTSPAKWAMLTPKQRQYIYRGFIVGLTQGEKLGYEKGEADTEEAVLSLYTNDRFGLHDWVVNHPKFKG